MAKDAPITGAANAATFDPAAWLCQLESSGGGYAVTDQLTLFVRDPDLADGKLGEGWQMIHALSPAQKAALFAHLSGHTAARSGQRPISIGAGNDAGNIQNRSDQMNMMTRIDLNDADTISAARMPFPNHAVHARHSQQQRPDLTKARPIALVIKQLASMRHRFATAFLTACAESDIDVSIMREHDGEDHVMFGCCCDEQETLRRKRLDALREQLQRGNDRRQQVINLLNVLGRFSDNQPYASIEDAAREFLSFGGRIYVLPDGRCEEAFPFRETWMQAERSTGYPVQRMLQRYNLTLSEENARKAMARYVGLHGKLHHGSQAIVLDQANDVMAGVRP